MRLKYLNVTNINTVLNGRNVVQYKKNRNQIPISGKKSCFCSKENA